MEILRFEDQGPKAPNRKKSSRGFLIVGLIATLFGISSAFASSTITINGGTNVDLGQGVVKVTGCDPEVNVSPHTSMTVETSGPTFYLDSINITNLDTQTAHDNGLGCSEKTFDVQVFYEDKSDANKIKAYSCSALNDSSYTATYFQIALHTLAKGCASSTLSFTMPAQSVFVSNLNPEFILHFEKAPSDISYITLVSRS